MPDDAVALCVTYCERCKTKKSVIIGKYIRAGGKDREKFVRILSRYFIEMQYLNLKDYMTLTESGVVIKDKYGNNKN